MNRLTYNFKEEYCEISAKRWNIDIEHLRKTYKGHVYFPNHNVRKEDMWHKLGQLEDDEERIGLSLHTLSHCSWVYVRKGKKIIRVPVLINLRCRWILIQAFWVFVKRMPFRKYGKTWALTKEELEK